MVGRTNQAILVIRISKRNIVNPLEIIMAKIGNLDGENLKNMQMQMEEQLWSVLNAAVSYSKKPFCILSRAMYRQQFLFSCGHATL